MRQFDLQRIRIEYNLTQKKVAELTGYPQGFVSVIERGKASAPEAFIEKVQSILNIENIDEYIKEVANIVIKEQKKAKKQPQPQVEAEQSLPIDMEMPKDAASPEQTIVGRFLDMLQHKDEKIDKLERKIEALEAELAALKGSECK